jgi:hypothetical protein
MINQSAFKPNFHYGEAFLENMGGGFPQPPSLTDRQGTPRTGDYFRGV